ncbi:hypothetical protein HCN44_007928 [Aphidius gifuensis]|uniref:Protein arginine N-methyltransferase n=1 Tax=Aphidius gifuensis TaxID=684658 RepID=A0A834Y106_APHGI|nr:protein arginine N-methyltransferase 7 [Aphidius gifuensis]KAF7995961.1 hypothetical protein HCN44_007928 [Aphidius gifuensis]
MSIFTRSFDPITGCSIWEEKHPDYDHHQEVARSAFADMLHDHERNEKYFVALKQAIEKVHSKGKKANVLDIGTGTGLLSMMAAKSGADSVTACEAFTPMAECAFEIIQKNGFESKVKLVQKRSTEMTVGENGDMKTRANILITEVFDTELIGEGALSTFKHAQQFLLEEDRIVIPNKGTVWIQVVESKTIQAWQKINEIRDPESEKVLISPPIAMNQCHGSSAVHDLQLSQMPYDSFTFLSNPVIMFNFDWSGKEPLIFNENVTKSTKAIASGTAQAIFMWWSLIMDPDNKVNLSCAPVWQHPDALLSETKDVESMFNAADRIPWRDHWMQAIYYLPNEIKVDKDQEIGLVACHDEYSFWFKVEPDPTQKVEYPRSPVCDCSVHLALSRSRIGQLNDKEKQAKYLKVLKKYITPDTVCFCFSDNSLIGLSVSNLGAKKTIILEPNNLSCRALQSFITANQLTDKVQIVQKVEDLPKNMKVNLVFGEPYYVNSIFPWDNLRFLYLSQKYAPGIPTVPMGGSIRGVAVEFKDLHKIRTPLGICEGFDMSCFDKLLLDSSKISDNPVEVHPLWEYPAKALTSIFDLAYFDFRNEFDETQEIKFKGNTPIFGAGSLNGLALWIDWHLDIETTVSTGPLTQVIPGERITWDKNTRQGVFLFRKIKNVTCQNAIDWSLTFNLKKDRIFEFNFNVKKS